MNQACLIVALVLAAAHVGQAGEPYLYQICDDLNAEMSRAMKDGATQGREMNIALELLAKNTHPTVHGQRKRLASAWKTLKADTMCGIESDTSIVTLHECRPLDYPNLKNNLGADLKQQVKRCSDKNEQMWESKLSSREGEMSKSSRDLLIQFVSTSFIEAYGNQYPDQKSLCLNYILVGSCIRPKLAGRAALFSLIKMYNERNSSNGLEYFRSKLNKVGKYLKDWLFQPCAKYVKKMEPRINLIKDVAYYYPGGQENFLATRTQNMREILIRYEFCSSLSIDFNRRALESDLMAALHKLDFEIE